MVIRSINLETVCGVTSTLPVNDKPEVAFAGKSNVGKSSLINALMNRKSYARISATPGKRRRSISITSMPNSIWSICRDTATPESLKKRKNSGER